MHAERDAAPATDTQRPDRAWRSVWPWGLFLTVAALGAASDLISKELVFDHYLEQPGLARWEKWTPVVLPPKQRDPEYTRYVLQNLHLSSEPVLGVRFTLSTNPGVVFGFDKLPRWIVNAFTGLAVVLMVGMFAASPRRDRWMHVALALILGGAIGNLYDRLFSSVALPDLPPIRYHVRDFIDASNLGYPWIFNLADAWLVIGVAMIAIHWLREAHAEAKAGKKRHE
jgi:signal peptidase II